MRKILPLILCGGSGTRLWPVSRESLPKQFAQLIGQRSTFQQAVLRVKHEYFADRPVIVGNLRYRDLIEQQLQEIHVKGHLILEPSRQDSGPAIVAGCLWAERHEPESLVLVVAADHYMDDEEAFRQAVISSIGAAEAGRLVAFGISPKHPAVEYGYIALSSPVEGESYAVSRFVEKPNAKMAGEYIEAGYLWNSGNFLFKPQALLNEYRSFHPNSVHAVEDAVKLGEVSNGNCCLDETSWKRAEPKSIDYAVMEHTSRAAVTKLDCGWSDIGSWIALWNLLSRDKNLNTSVGPTTILDSQRCLAFSSGPVTALLGVKDISVIAESDAVLVVDSSRTAEVKKLVEFLRSKGVREAVHGRNAVNPWGSSQLIHSSNSVEVRRVVVNPLTLLPEMCHHDRIIHWTIVQGRADAIIGETERELEVNSNVSIGAGVRYSLDNSSDQCVIIIETQVTSKGR